MTPAQCRAARALIGMSQSDLARAAVVPVASVADVRTIPGAREVFSRALTTSRVGRLMLEARGGERVSDCWEGSRARGEAAGRRAHGSFFWICD